MVFRINSWHRLQMEALNQLFALLARISLIGVTTISIASCAQREPNPALLGEWVMPEKFPGKIEFDGLKATIHPSVGCGMSHCNKLTGVVDYDLEVAGDRYSISFDDRQIVSGQEGWTGKAIDRESRSHKWEDLALQKQDDCTFINLPDRALMHSAAPDCLAVPLRPISADNEQDSEGAIYLISRYQDEDWSIYSRHSGREKLEINDSGADILSDFACGTIGVVATEIPTRNGQARRLVVHGISEDIQGEPRPC